MSDTTPASFVLLPGVMGLTLPPGMSEETAYPDISLDLVKTLRLHGGAADFLHDRADRVAVSHNAAEIWLPILSMAGDGSLNVALNILASAIYDLFVRHRIGAQGDNPPLLHVELRKSPDSDEVLLRVDGPPDEAIEAVRLLADKLE